MNEQDASEWTALVRRDCDEPEVAECLLRHGVSLDAVEWDHGAGSIPLPKVGVTLKLWKTDGSNTSVVFVQGIEFGQAYEGSLPHRIDASDTLMEIGMKLSPAVVVPGKRLHTFDAVFPEHRLAIEMDEDDILQSVTWLTTRELRPG